MTSQLMIGLVIFALIIIGFLSRKFPMAWVSMTGFVLMTVFGVLDTKTALTYFGKDTWIVISGLCIVGAAFSKTTYVGKIAVWLAKRCDGSTIKITACYVLIEVILAQFISSIIAFFSMVYPLAIASCKKMKISPSRLIYSLGIIAMSTSYMIPATSAVAMAERLRPLFASYGMEQYADFNINYWCLSRCILAAIVIPIAIFYLPKHMPDRIPVEDVEDTMVSAEGMLQNEQVYTPFQEKVVGIVFALICLGFAFNAQINKIVAMPIWLITLVGVMIIIGVGAMRGKELYCNMGINVVFLAMGASAVGAGIANCGAADLIGSALIQIFGTHPNGYMFGFVLFIVTCALAQFITNPPVAWTFIPIAIIACKAFGANPLGPVFLIMSSTMCGFCLPTASVTASTMIGVGGYELSDMVKKGIPICLIASILYTAIIMTVFPFY